MRQPLAGARVLCCVGAGLEWESKQSMVMVLSEAKRETGGAAPARRCWRCNHHPAVSQGAAPPGGEKRKRLLLPLPLHASLPYWGGGGRKPGGGPPGGMPGLQQEQGQIA